MLGKFKMNELEQKYDLFFQILERTKQLSDNMIAINHDLSINKNFSRCQIRIKQKVFSYFYKDDFILDLYLKRIPNIKSLIQDFKQMDFTQFCLIHKPDIFSLKEVDIDNLNQFLDFIN